LLDRLREAIRVRHYSIRTEQAYVQWVRRFIFFHNKRHPNEMGRPEIEAFLTHLAVEGRVAAATQNQALNALVFLYKEVLKREVGEFENLVWAKRNPRVPVVLTVGEVRTVLEQIHDIPGLMARMLYGSGVRLLECCSRG
jgi:site-specific recombinase XerD